MKEVEKIRNEDCRLRMKQGKPLNAYDKVTRLPHMFRIISSEYLKDLKKRHKIMSIFQQNKLLNCKTKKKMTEHKFYQVCLKPTRYCSNI